MSPLQVQGWECSTLSSGQGTLGSEPTVLAPANSGRRAIHIHNGGSAIMYVGHSSSLSSSNGFVVVAGGGLDLFFYNGPIYIVGSNGSASYIEESE